MSLCSLIIVYFATWDSFSLQPRCLSCLSEAVILSLTDCRFYILEFPTREGTSFNVDS